MMPPIRVDDLELTEKVTDVHLPERADGLSYEGARLLVRLQGMPLGYVCVEKGGLAAEEVAAAVWRELETVINARRRQHGLEGLRTLTTEGVKAESALAEAIDRRPFVSVVLCTRDRPNSLLVTLRGLATQHYKAFEVVVVDNAPSSDDTRDAFRSEFGADRRFRYVREPERGSSSAKNRGVAEAAAEIIAFTDDDVRVDKRWLEGIVRGFQQTDDVACVTGLVRAAALDNGVQLYFDQRQAWGLSCERRIFDLSDHRDHSPLYPYSNVYGAGANFAMTRTALSELGGFDAALGAGTLSGGGEDLDIFVRTVLAGHRLVYEPSAIVSHVHRAEIGELSRQMRAYGSGATAALTALLLRSRRARLELPTKVVIGAIRISAIGSRTKDQTELPSGLVRQELQGMMRGPWLYLKGRRQLRRSHRSGC